MKCQSCPREREVRTLLSTIENYPGCRTTKTVDVQADLSLRWAHMYSCMQCCGPAQILFSRGETRILILMECGLV